MITVSQINTVLVRNMKGVDKWNITDNIGCKKQKTKENNFLSKCMHHDSYFCFQIKEIRNNEIKLKYILFLQSKNKGTYKYAITF
jgi:hypothetical protein